MIGNGNKWVVVASAVAAAAVVVANCITSPDEVERRNRQQVRVSQALGDSVVTFEGRVLRQGASLLEVESCDGAGRRTFYGTFVVEHARVCQ